ncbi:MAG: hypothetical protein ACQXXL_06115, partial [Candidatus Methanosuratincola sp.]
HHFPISPRMGNGATVGFAKIFPFDFLLWKDWETKNYSWCLGPLRNGLQDCPGIFVPNLLGVLS